MRKWFKNQRGRIVTGILVGLVLIALPILSISHHAEYPAQNVGQHLVLTIGNPQTAYAAGSIDYGTDGIADNVQFNQAIGVLQAHGGGEVYALTSNFTFATTVNVPAGITIRGTGRASYFANNGVTAIFTQTGNNVIIENLRTDAGGIAVGATTGWKWENVWAGTTFYSLRTPISTTATAYNFPTGRTAQYVIAAADATLEEKAQADTVANGYSTLSGTIANGTGTLSAGSPQNLVSGANISIAAPGGDVTFTVTLAAGQRAHTWGSYSVHGNAGNGYSKSFVAGANTLTMDAAGVPSFQIAGMGDEQFINTALTAGYTDIYLTSGTFFIADNVTVSGNATHIHGSGAKTVWKQAPYSLKYYEGWIGNGVHNAIQNLEVDNIYFVSDTQVWDPTIPDPYNWPIWTWNAVGTKVHDNWFADSYGGATFSAGNYSSFYNNTAYRIRDWIIGFSGEMGSSASNNQMYGFHDTTTLGFGIRIEGGSKDTTITGNTIAYTRAAIGTDNGSVTRLTITGNTVFNQVATYPSVSIPYADVVVMTGNSIYAGAVTLGAKNSVYTGNMFGYAPINFLGDNNVFEGNTFYLNSNNFSSNTATNSIIRNNRGWTTESYGSVTITGNSVAKTFTHFLSATPTYFNMAFTSVPTGNVTWGWTATSTTVTITLSNPQATDLTAKWEALVR